MPAMAHRVRLSILLYLLASAASAAAGETLHPGYTWSDIGDGIYLHSRDDPFAGPVDGNSVVIVNDDGVIVIDTHIDPAASRAVIRKIRALTDQPVTHVVNTHWHDDHVNGNDAYRDAFPGVHFVAHRATLAALEKEWAPMEAQRREAYAKLDPAALLEAASGFEASDPQKATNYRVYAGYVAALKPELDSLELVYPDTTFDDRFEIESTSRRIVVEWLGRGNTDGDAIVWLPDDDVLITGDLLVAPVPYAFDSPMLDWVETLDRLGARDAGTLVPGHGPVQHDQVYLDRVRMLLRTTLDAVARAHAGGATPDTLAEAVDLADLEAAFTGGDSTSSHAWRAYYFTPGLASAWSSLGLPQPAEK